MSISLVAGLGNPGREYEGSRHNLGWLVVDAYASKHGLSWRAAPEFDAMVARRDAGPGSVLWLMKPLTFMNESGRSVGAMARYHRVPADSVAAAYDDLTIDLGLVKVSVSGSDAGHNGVASLIEHLGQGFSRYRLGVGPRQPPEMDMKDFVLARFTPDQLNIIKQKSEFYVQGLELLLASGPDRAMNQLNRRDTK
ncbi:MAG TPA: aminoacyl-tRNA hydrolase [Opitutaceae bacterium]|jgi:PTH1 family peptidyl-tRNA hydrolase